MARTVRALALVLLAIAACGGDDAGEGSRPSTSTTARPQPRATTTTTTTTAADVAPARFASSVAEVTATELGTTWREGCPVPPEGLRRVTMSHWGMDGAVHEGQLVVAADVVDQIVAVFDGLFTARYPVQRMEPISAFGGDDQASMAANNTSAFNCRTVAGTDRLSEHAFGRAIDVNPLLNPYVRGGTVDPPSGARYADRTRTDPGIIHDGDAVVAAFAAQGWQWGGHWQNGQDHQHFSPSGR